MGGLRRGGLWQGRAVPRSDLRCGGAPSRRISNILLPSEIALVEEERCADSIPDAKQAPDALSRRSAPREARTWYAAQPRPIGIVTSSSISTMHHSCHYLLGDHV